MIDDDCVILYMIVDLADNDDHDRLPRYFKGQESMDNNTIIE